MAGAQTSEEIASQPETWARAAELAAERSDVLPLPGETVAVIGCGTSWFMAQAYAALREAAGNGRTDAFAASEFPAGRDYDRLVAISRSGTTTEVERLLAELGPERALAITAVVDSPVAARAGSVIALDFADERSVVQTRFATSALALLRAHEGHSLDAPIAEARRALELPLPVSADDVDHVVFLGHGWSVGIAHEAALKLREAAQVTAESYPAMEYRHGPISLAGERSFVWILATPDDGVADDVAAVGARVRTAELDPMAELVLAHRLALAFAEARGLDPDRPRHLTRAVVLP
jgi:fructoselysine-6-P-deglycase FrlB-like protein